MARAVFNAGRAGCGGSVQTMNITHHLHHLIIRHGQSILAVARDAIVVAIAIGISSALVPWIAPIVARWCPFLIC